MQCWRHPKGCDFCHAVPLLTKSMITVRSLWHWKPRTLPSPASHRGNSQRQWESISAFSDICIFGLTLSLTCKISIHSISNSYFHPSTTVFYEVYISIFINIFSKDVHFIWGEFCLVKDHMITDSSLSQYILTCVFILLKLIAKQLSFVVETILIFSWFWEFVYR